MKSDMKPPNTGRRNYQQFDVKDFLQDFSVALLTDLFWFR